MSVHRVELVGRTVRQRNEGDRGTVRRPRQIGGGARLQSKVGQALRALAAWLDQPDIAVANEGEPALIWRPVRLLVVGGSACYWPLSAACSCEIDIALHVRTGVRSDCGAKEP